MITLTAVLEWLVGFVCNVAIAVVVWFVGKFIIGKIMDLLGNNKKLSSMEPTVRSFALSFVKIALYAVLVISIISILGIETASIVAVLASAGLAVGLALQGALSNLAGGIMIVVFKPFKLGDYVDAAGASGVVTEVTLFYTVITTLDNKRITVPNGSLMNANIVDYSAEENRRVDLTFSCAKSESPERIQEIILGAVAQCDNVLQEPAAPFARVSGGTNEAMEFTVRVWTKGATYWDVYFDVIQKVTTAFGENGVAAPAVRVVAK